jgi:hypothetical protein
MSNTHNFEAWCSQHQMHPTDCWKKHVQATERNIAVSQQQLRERIIARHKELQDALVECSFCGKYVKDTEEHEAHRCAVLREARGLIKQRERSADSATDTTEAKSKRLDISTPSPGTNNRR